MSGWQQLSEQYLQLQLRERRLLFFASVILLLWFGLLYLLEPMWQQLQTSRQQYKQSLTQINELQTQADQLVQLLNQDPDAGILKDIDQAQRQREQLNQQIRLLAGRYVGPEQMPALLEDVLKKLPAVQLTGLKTLPAEAVRLSGSGTVAVTTVAATAAAGQAESGSGVPLYLHRTQLIFQGNYAGLQQLLAALEQLPWQLHWHQLDYQVLEHPQAELRLELETLSEQADYLRL